MLQHLFLLLPSLRYCLLFQKPPPKYTHARVAFRRGRHARAIWSTGQNKSVLAESNMVKLFSHHYLLITLFLWWFGAKIKIRYIAQPHWTAVRSRFVPLTAALLLLGICLQPLLWRLFTGCVKKLCEKKSEKQQHENIVIIHTKTSEYLFFFTVLTEAEKMCWINVTNTLYLCFSASVFSYLIHNAPQHCPNVPVEKQWSSTSCLSW